MLSVLRSQWPLLRRTLSILAGAGVRYTTGAAVVGLVLTLLNPELGQSATGLLGGTWVAFSRWWSLIPLGLLALLFVYGLMKANHEAFEKIERGHKQELNRLQEANNNLQARLATLETRPRTAAEELKHECLQHGKKLSQHTEQWFAEYCKAEEREPPSLTERQRLQRAREISVVSNRARHEYEKKFRDRAVKLFELAEERGLAEPNWKRTAKNAGGSLQRMQMVAERLIRIGRD